MSECTTVNWVTTELIPVAAIEWAIMDNDSLHSDLKKLTRLRLKREFLIKMLLEQIIINISQQPVKQSPLNRYYVSSSKDEVIPNVKE
ncbi:hypothetical protein LguiB_009633 [Lonicera macranthoides]